MLATTRRRAIAGTGLVLVAAAAAIAWWLISPLFIDTVVDEAFPFDVPTQAEMEDMPPADVEALEAEFEAAMPSDATIQELSEDDRAEVAEKVMKAAAMLPGATVDEAPPAVLAPETTATAAPEAAPTVEAPRTTPTAPPEPTPTAAAPEPIPLVAGPEAVLVGAFMDADSSHRGEGTATIYQTGDGMLTLRLEDFSVTNGPALSVLLSPHPSPARSDDLGEYLDLGPLKGNKGNQNYEIDLPIRKLITEYASVVIYCVPFHIVFSIAPLTP